MELKPRLCNLTYNSDSLKFLNEMSLDDHYTLVYSKERDLDKKLTPEYTNSVDRICSFCELTENDGVKFKEIKHIIPAFFGDPKLYSVEECDTCNNEMGKLYEDHLARMLNAQLISTSINGRKTKKTLKFQGSKEKVELKKDVGVTYFTENPPNFDERTGELKVKLPQESFVPKYAIKSFLHMIWLLLDPELRNRNLWIKERVKNTESEVLLKFYSGYYFRKKNNVKIQIYKRKSSNNKISNLYFILYYGCYYISYNLDEDGFKPCILPDFEVYPESCAMPSGLITDLSNINKVKYQEKEFTYNFESFSKGGNSSVSQIEKTLNTLVSITVDGKEYIYKTKLEGFKNGDIVVSGEDLAGNFTFNIITNHESLFKSSFDNISIFRIKRTIDFLQNLKKNSMVIIKDLFTQKDIYSFHTNSISYKKELIELIEKVYFINSYLDIDVKFKTNLSNNDLIGIDKLYKHTIEIKNDININKIDLLFDCEDKLEKDYKLFENKINDSFMLNYLDIGFKYLGVNINLKDFFYFDITKLNKLEKNKTSITLNAEKIKIIRIPI